MALNIFQLLKAYDYSNQALENFDCSSLFNKKLINNLMIEDIDDYISGINNQKNDMNDDTYELALSKNNIKEVKIYNYINLKNLYLDNNNNLERIEIKNCKKLEKLNISNCLKLKEIIGLEENKPDMIICKNTNIDFLEEKFDINVSLINNNDHINYIIDNIYLGDSSHTEDELLTIGVSYVFNISMNHYREYKKIIEIKCPTEDIITQNILLSFPKIIEKMKDLVDKGKTIYVHCHAGISRSASVIILYLIKYYKYTFKEAFRFLRNKRQCIQPNPGFVLQLKILEKEYSKYI
jgi:rhodanese-related sulfurtransferase